VALDHLGRSARCRWSGWANGLGAYHFFTLCSPGASQAANFLKIAPPGSTDLQPAVDLELAGNCSARPRLSEVRSQLSDFLRRVEAATKQSVIFYIGASFDRRYPLQGIDASLLWKRSILRRPSGAWAIWQVDGLARIDGITGRADLDVMKRDDLLGPVRNLPASLPRITPGGCCRRDRPETESTLLSRRTALR
jgi:lysozyme